MDLYAWVDVFFFLEPPGKRSGGFVEHERDEFELFSFKKDSGVEVFVRTGVVGLISVVRHDEMSAVMEFVDDEGRKRKFGGVYLSPTKGMGTVVEWLERLEDCNILVGDFNARHRVWGERCGDIKTNTYGTALLNFIRKYGYGIQEPKCYTFRNCSAIDLCVSDIGTKSELVDKGALEHMGQITRLSMRPVANMNKASVNWRKVDWTKAKEDLKEIAERNGDYEEIIMMVDNLEKKTAFRKGCGWWNKELEKMVKEVKFLRRSADREGWRLARKVLRNRLINERYDYLKRTLEQTKDPEIFKAIKALDGRRVVPAMVKENGDTVYNHEGISDLVADQLKAESPRVWDGGEVDLVVEEEEITKALKDSPTNTACGKDNIRYPFLRFWLKSQPGHMTETLNNLIRIGYDRWNEAHTVLIKKADKERYDSVKSWRMIHLLPTISKVVDRIILRRLEKEVTLSDTQYGSRKRRGCHDCVKQISEFLKFGRFRCTALMTMDVEGGFDNINTELLADILRYRSCDGLLVSWIMRWTTGRKMRLKFNGRTSRVYGVDKGVPQGSPLSPYLFGIYVEEIFKPRFKHRPSVSSLVSSYVDDSAVMVSGESREIVVSKMRELYEDCDRIARLRNMRFAARKVEWMGIGSGEWPDLWLGGEKKDMCKEIRILGYRWDVNGSIKAHVDYWIERAMGVRRRIAGVGRRYGSKGGLGGWEYTRLLQAAYLPTIWYGLEFVDDPKLIKMIDVKINDTIRSLFRVPLKSPINAMREETGIGPTDLQRKCIQRKCYRRSLNRQYGKEYPWFGCVEETWGIGCEDFKVSMRNSDKALQRSPKIVIKGTKDKAREWHEEMVEELSTGKGRNWVYTDGSKKEGKAAIAWTWMTGDGAAEATRNMAVEGRYNIDKIEMMAIASALSEAGDRGVKKCWVFTDSKSAAMAIEKMESEDADSAGLWDIMVPILNRLDEVGIGWIPAHCGILGNEMSDKASKAGLRLKLDWWRNKQWEDYNDGNGMEKDMLRSEWAIWHKEEGHDYYKRNRKTMSHLKTLSRLDCYVLFRLRIGVGKHGGKPCDDEEERFHTLKCDRFKDTRPDGSTIFDDGKIDVWKRWWMKHEYLGMGIPSTMTEQLEERVMFGNPFDHTVTIERNGQIVVEQVAQKPCDGCDKVHTGPCMKRVVDMRGRWFFVGEEEMNCKSCGGGFGGGSTSRPGGYGLKAHLGRNKRSCGRKMEIDYWTDIVKEREGWDVEFRNAIVLKWSKLNRVGKKDCWKCGKVYANSGVLRKHVRCEVDCFEYLEKLMLDNPVGWG